MKIARDLSVYYLSKFGLTKELARKTDFTVQYRSDGFVNVGSPLNGIVCSMPREPFDYYFGQLDLFTKQLDISKVKLKSGALISNIQIKDARIIGEVNEIKESWDLDGKYYSGVESDFDLIEDV